jgi:hypothetical protein
MTEAYSHLGRGGVVTASAHLGCEIPPLPKLENRLG